MASECDHCLGDPWHALELDGQFHLTIHPQELEITGEKIEKAITVHICSDDLPPSTSLGGLLWIVEDSDRLSRRTLIGDILEHGGHLAHLFATTGTDPSEECSDRSDPLPPVHVTMARTRHQPDNRGDYIKSTLRLKLRVLRFFCAAFGVS